VGFCRQGGDQNAFHATIMEFNGVLLLKASHETPCH